ncbi:NTP transferase domain-containing protein, partial [Micromonospora sp. NPDC051296]|uniref:NTP transferase domain-containing protein n=1 Tax=Micromonospora sp. NPDC051296 TaxID=3155046 RepID=UPI0034410C14
MSQPWTAVVPVKRLTAAKSRLRGGVPGVPHEDLALALAADTLEAVRACPGVAEVLVVTDDARVSATARRAGARVLPDVPDAGLNAAFRHGAAGAGGWVAGLTADLPALRPDELAAALRAAQAG